MVARMATYGARMSVRNVPGGCPPDYCRTCKTAPCLLQARRETNPVDLLDLVERVFYAILSGHIAARQLVCLLAFVGSIVGLLWGLPRVGLVWGLLLAHKQWLWGIGIGGAGILGGGYGIRILRRRRRNRDGHIDPDSSN